MSKKPSGSGPTAPPPQNAQIHGPPPPYHQVAPQGPPPNMQQGGPPRPPPGQPPPQMYGQPPPPHMQQGGPPPPQGYQPPPQGYPPQQQMYGQQPPPPVIYNQSSPGISLGVGSPGMVEVCPHCRRAGVMMQSRSPTSTAICLAILAVLFLGAGVIGILICIYLIWFSECVDINFTCPYCGKIVRQLQGQ